MSASTTKVIIARHDGTVISQYVLGNGTHVIGSEQGLAVWVDDAEISLHHAKLHLSQDSIAIEDLDSITGTFVDGIAVRGRIPLQAGQSVYLGQLYLDIERSSTRELVAGGRLADGRFVLVEKLGQGAMGTVWKAMDRESGRAVALKLLPPEVGEDEGGLADMKREVSKTKALNHPNIVKIGGLWRINNEPAFITLEFVDGSNLQEIASRSPNGVLGWNDVKHYMMQLCDALEYAHSQNIAHRDIKPSNLMVDQQGNLKLADFGIAASIAGTVSTLTSNVLQSGTPAYMSPQQLKGGTPSASDDLYALGATFFKLLTGTPPFYQGDIIHQLLHVPAKPIADRLKDLNIQNEVPDYVGAMVMACLQKDAANRPERASAVWNWIESQGAVSGILAKSPEESVPPPPIPLPVSPPKKESKRIIFFKEWAKIGGGLAALIALIYGIFILFQGKGSTNDEQHSWQTEEYIKGKRFFFKIQGAELWFQFDHEGESQVWHGANELPYKVTGNSIRRMKVDGERAEELFFERIPLKHGDRVILRENGKEYELTFSSYSASKENEYESPFAKFIHPNITGAFNSKEVQDRIKAEGSFEYMETTISRLDSDDTTREGTLWPVLTEFVDNPSTDNLKIQNVDKKRLTQFLNKYGYGSNVYSCAQIPDAELAWAAQWLANYEVPLREIERGLNIIKTGKFPIDTSNGINTLLPHLSKYKPICRMFRVRILANIQNGIIEGAIRDILLMERMAKTLSREPFLVSHLMQVECLKMATYAAMDLLNRQKLNEQQLKMLADCFGWITYPDDGFVLALLWDRGSTLNAFKANPRSLARAWGEKKSTEEFLKWVRICARPETEIKKELLLVLDSYNAAIKAERTWYPTRIEIGNREWEKFLQTTGRFQNRGRFPIATAAMSPLKDAMFVSADAYASVKCLNVIIALERYRLRNRGLLPPNLQAVQSLLPLPRFGLNDPYSNKQLNYSWAPGFRYSVYSVGRNFKDDGGRYSTAKNSEDIVQTIASPNMWKSISVNRANGGSMPQPNNLGE